MGPRATIQRVRGSGAAVLHAPARDRAAIVGLRFGVRRRDAAEASLDELAGRLILGIFASRASRARTREGTVPMEVEGPVDVLERWRREGWGREPRCA